MIGTTTTVFGSGLLGLVAFVGKEVQVELAYRGQVIAILNGELIAANDVAGTDADDNEEILLTVGGDGILLRRQACVDVQTWPTMIVFDLDELRVTIRRAALAP